MIHPSMTYSNGSRTRRVHSRTGPIAAGFLLLFLAGCVRAEREYAGTGGWGDCPTVHARSQNVGMWGGHDGWSAIEEAKLDA